MISLIMPSEQINEIKCKLSETYIKALTSKLNYALQISGREFDAEGIDLSIIKKGGGTGSILTVQLKSTSLSSKSMVSYKENEIQYNLLKSYDNIVENTYLFLVIFPPEKELENWCKINEDDLLLKATAYYIKLPTQKGIISIPKTNILNETTLPTLFIPSSQKEDFF